ncbi:MAG: phosphotransferase [Candidatus Promineofilum sp.]|nr:phosphotransferase [Promineifilum sp.]
MVITTPDQVTPEWLTAVLATSGALVSGSVIAFDVDAGRGNWSSNAILHVRYSDGAQGQRPPRLFLKMVETDLDDESFGASEVTYYTRDYVGATDAPLVRCYDAAYSEALRRYHLLLDDVSPTHVTAADKPPTLAYGLALAEGLAALHAHWWGAARLAEAAAPIHDAPTIRRFVAIAEPGADPILAALENQLEPHWPALIRELYAKHPQALIARTADANGFTLIHGDVGENNVLVPREGERPIYLIDRQPFDWSLTTWLGVYDLAYAMILDWDTSARRAWEMPVLRRYHDELRRRGVAGYSWERLIEDYRLMAAMGVYIATEYCRGGVTSRWWSFGPVTLQRVLTACDDLQCADLW